MRQSKYTRELLAPIVESSTSVSEVLRKLGISSRGGGNNRLINNRIRVLGLSVAHFTGSNWSKGLTAETSEVISMAASKKKVSDEDFFIENCPYNFNGPRVRKRLIALGWDYKCTTCGLDKWLGKAITLHVDHINGVCNDNGLTNLRFLCPNCHQQTETWGNKKGYKK